MKGMALAAGGSIVPGLNKLDEITPAANKIEDALPGASKLDDLPKVPPIRKIPPIKLAPTPGWKSTNAFHDLPLNPTEAQLKALTSKNSAKLRDSLGDAIEKGQDAHHIVQSGDKRAAAARQLLDKYEIDINDAVNGIGLKPTGTKPAHHGHGLHSDDAINAVTDRLNRAVDGVSDWAKGRQLLLEALAKLGSSDYLGG
jgi:A nuclease family of the HNH/ENDO VII superfamily with conserved AHH